MAAGDLIPSRAAASFLHRLPGQQEKKRAPYRIMSQASKPRIHTYYLAMAITFRGTGSSTVPDIQNMVGYGTAVVDEPVCIQL